MAKKHKLLQKVLKIFVCSSLILAALSIFVGFGFVSYVTKDSHLDITKLHPKQNNISFLSANGDNIAGAIIAQVSDIPKHTLNAFIAKEDKRFYSHNGVDYIRILGALKSNLKAKEYKEGGSTITQQLIKNTHLTQEKTVNRKLKEIKLSKKLEKSLSKDEILNAYLNSIYFGNGITGIAGAAKYYFSKDVKDLSLAESAILSGLISAPSVFNPVANFEKSKEKALMVLALMEEQKFITNNQKLEAENELDTILIAKNKDPSGIYSIMAEYEALKILGVDSFSQTDKIVIKTYLNSSIQNQLTNITQSEYSKAFMAGGTTPGIASLVIDNSTGGILAFSGECQHNLALLKRQPASTIKPILVYGPAIEYMGYSPATMVLDEPINIGGYSPQNATKKYYGLTTIRDNIVRSTNVPAVKVLNETGLEKSKKFAQNFGITFHQEDNNLAIALGGFTEGVTLKDLATSYMALANGGQFINSAFVKEIIINGYTVYSHQPQKSRACSKETAYLITDMLKSVSEYGTARKLNTLNLPIASKTGTNFVDGFNMDGYNVSYTTSHTFLAWIGELGTPTTGSDNIYNGSTYPTHIVKNIAEFIYTDNLPLDFYKPSTIKTISIDQEEFLKGNLIIADEFSSGEIHEIFSVYNLPQKRNVLPPLENIHNVNLSGQNTPNFNLVYDNLIKKYGVW